MMIVNIHNYAGKGYTKTVQLNVSPEKYVQGVQTAGYDGPMAAILERLYDGQLVSVEQFAISFSINQIEDDRNNQLDASICWRYYLSIESKNTQKPRSKEYEKLAQHTKSGN